MQKDNNIIPQYKNSLDIEIFGELYHIKTDEDIDYIKEVVKYLNNKLNDTSKKVPTLSPLRTVLFTALNITDELFKCRRLYEEKLKNIIENINKTYYVEKL